MLQFFVITLYSRISTIQTPLCQVHHKSVKISEFVWISEAHSLIYTVVINYTLIEHTLGVEVILFVKLRV